MGKLICLSIFWIAFFISHVCSSQTKTQFLSKPFFYGHRFPYSAFVKRNSDYLIAEIFYIDKRPREYFCDTLVADGVNRFKGNFTQIYRTKNRYYVSFTKDVVGRKIRIKNDSVSYENLYDIKAGYRAYLQEQEKD